MTEIKIHAVIGTKAQLIKMAPILKELQDRNISYNLIFTGQHFETIDEVRDNFSLKEADHNLNPNTDVTGIVQMFLWVIKILYILIKDKKKIFGKVNKKHYFLVHGDTLSTLLGAFVGKLFGGTVCHIESRLRSFNIFHPFPEELTRIFTFYLTDIYFCPNEWAIKNLEKFKGKKINTKINTLFDSLNLAVELTRDLKVDIPNSKFVICSIHRFENIFNKERLSFIINEIKQIGAKYKVLFILHAPTLSQLKKLELYEDLKQIENIELRPRYDYFTFTNILNKAEFLVTDGGSNQEESFYLGKPCLLMRNATERNEGIGKNVVLSLYDKNKIEEFVINYGRYKIDMLKMTESPSKIVVENILN